MAYLWFTAFCLVYFFIHSALATTSVKWFVEDRWAFGFRFYRLFYNLIAVIGLLALIWYYLHLPKGPALYKAQILSYVAGVPLMLAGAYIMYRGFQGYRLPEFLGLEALQNLKTIERLHTEGLNARVRHPLYSGSILLLVGFVITQGHTKAALMAGIFTAYLCVGALLEEKKLIRQFGDDYLDYQRKVGFLVPRFWIF